MEEPEVIVDSSVAVGGVTVIPVVEVSLSHWRVKGGFAFYGAKRPVGLVVVSPAGKKAFRITGEEVALETLVQEVTGIEDVLAVA